MLPRCNKSFIALQNLLVENFKGLLKGDFCDHDTTIIKIEEKNENFSLQGINKNKIKSMVYVKKKLQKKRK